MRTFMLVVTGLFLAVAACSSYGTSVVEVDQKDAKVASVSLTVPESIVAGSTALAVATPKDARGNSLDRPVTWETSSTNIAAVDASGLISAVAPGTAVVRAISEGISAQANMSVLPRPRPPVASVQVAVTPSAVVVGQTAIATANLIDSSGNPVSDGVVTWASSNVSVASVNASGIVQATGPGVAMIQASSEGKTSASSFSVSAPAPVPVASVSVTPASSTIQISGTVQLAAVTRDSNNNTLPGRAVAWSSANTSIATVSGSGLVTAVAVGNTSITASSEGQTSSAAITVSAPPPAAVASVSVSPASGSLQLGGTLQLAAVTRDASNNIVTGRVVTWTTNNPGVATVSSSGLVTAVAVGSATITATSESRTATSVITVTAPPPIAVASVSVSPATASLPVGETVQLSAVARDAAGNALAGRTVSWTSSNPAVSTVSSSGLVRAIAIGNATINATSESKTGNSVVTVTANTGPVWRKNEPVGMAAITDRPFNTKNENSAWDPYGSDAFTIVTDPAAPQSPSNVIRATYHAGFGAGGAPAHSGIPHTAYSKIYMCFAVKLSANWVGNGSGVNKMIYEWTTVPHPSFFFAAYGSGSGPLQPRAMLQDIIRAPSGGGFVAPNLVPSAQIIRGRWHVVEVFIQGNTSGTANGVIDWYLDGVHVGSVTGFQWTTSNTAFSTFELYPIWGGGNTTPAITATQTMDFDHIYISGKN